jgi:hypothetical protein
MKEENKQPYDKTKMQYKNVLTFKFGNYKGIENNHFEIRRAERTSVKTTDIFEKSGLSDKDAVLECIKILERDKYDYIVETTLADRPKQAQFVVGFETDEPLERGTGNYFIFIVVAISKKETAINDISTDEDFFACITIVKDKCKKRVKLKDNETEYYLSYRIDRYGENYWSNKVDFC